MYPSDPGIYLGDWYTVSPTQSRGFPPQGATFLGGVHNFPQFKVRRMELPRDRCSLMDPTVRFACSLSDGFSGESCDGLGL